VANNIDQGEDEVNALVRSVGDRYTNSLLYLHNINPGQIKSNFKGQHETLHSLRLFGRERFQMLCQSLLRCSDTQKLEIYGNLKQLLGQSEISLVSFLSVLSCSFSEDQEEVREVLSYLCEKLSGIYLEEGSGGFHFSEVVSLLVREIYSYLPISYYPNFLVKFHNKSDIFIRLARIIFEEQQLDVTQLVTKHFLLNSHIHKRPCISFDRQFCRDLEAIFEIQRKNNQLELECNRFEIILEVQNQNQAKSYTVPFKLDTLGAIGTFCKYRNPVFFEKNYSLNNLVARGVLADVYLQSPFCFSTQISTKKQALTFLHKTFEFAFIFDKKEFLKVRVRFSEKTKNHRVTVGLEKWSYETQNSLSLLEFSRKEIDLSFPFSFFFFTLEHLKDIIFNSLLTKLEKKEIFQLIQINTPKVVLKNHKGKDIEKKSLILDLKSYQDVEFTNEDFKIQFVFRI
jgi:hypothetical protein